MQGVVSLLDDAHQAMIEQLQSELDRALGIQGLCTTPIPHFSYHVADEYDPELLAAALLSFAGSNRRFRVRTSGFGVFTSTRPVVYIPVVRSPMLNIVHHVLWRQLTWACRNPSPHYHPTCWLPHITLADSPVVAQHLPDLAGLLSDIDLCWEIEVTNVALLYGAGEALELQFRHELLSSHHTRD